MSSTADTGDVVEVADDGITVTKQFTADEFPVPAIRFEFSSDHDGPVWVRLSEDIPRSFPMDGVGFHPEYHSDQWTAFEDNRVEFTGTVDPDEPLVTVYGIRIDDESESEQFLTEPSLVDVRPDGDGPDESTADGDAVEDTMISDIVGDDRNQVVKDMLVGDSSSVPGLDDDASDTDGEDGTVPADEDLDGLDLDLGDVDTEPVDVPDEGTDAPDIDVDFGDESIPGGDDGPRTDAESDSGSDADRTGDEPKIELDIESAVASSAESADDNEDESSNETEDESPAGADDEPPSDASEAAPTNGGGESSIAERLAAEIRRGTVDDDDLDAIAAELDASPDGSDEARVQHLQSRVEEVAAYTGALETFLDEKGTGSQLIEEFEEELETFRTDLAAVDDRLDATASDVDALDDQVQSLGDDVDSVEGEVRDLAADVDDIDEAVDDLGSDVETIESDVETVEGEVAGLADDLDSVREEVTDLVEWRDQLGSMFNGE